MKLLETTDQRLDAGSLAGIATGLGMLLPAFLVPELAVLAAPALLVLVPSLIVGFR